MIPAAVHRRRRVRLLRRRPGGREVPAQLQRRPVQRPDPGARLLQLLRADADRDGGGVPDPVAILTATRLGIATPRQLPRTVATRTWYRGRRDAAAGTDPVSMLIEMVPLLLLFEFSLVLARISAPPTSRRTSTPAPGGRRGSLPLAFPTHALRSPEPPAAQLHPRRLRDARRADGRRPAAVRNRRRGAGGILDAVGLTNSSGGSGSANFDRQIKAGRGEGRRPTPRTRPRCCALVRVHVPRAPRAGRRPQHRAANPPMPRPRSSRRRPTPGTAYLKLNPGKSTSAPRPDREGVHHSPRPRPRPRGADQHPARGQGAADRRRPAAEPGLAVAASRSTSTSPAIHRAGDAATKKATAPLSRRQAWR